jgi:hypothetical protein
MQFIHPHLAGKGHIPSSLIRDVQKQLNSQKEEGHCENDIIAIKLNDCFINDSGCALVVDFIIDEYAKSGNVYGIGYRTNVHDSK